MFKDINELKVDVPAWVDRAKSDPVTHLQRQATEVTLNAIALTWPLNEQLVLKGGTLMALVYDSHRQTSDIDLSADRAVEPEIGDEIKELLDASFPRAAAKLGYADIVIKAHSVKKMPNSSIFAEASFPALKIKIAYATRGTGEEKTMKAGKPINEMFEIDISFNEPLRQIQILSLDGEGDLLAYSMTDLIAEKYRAMLQQVQRNRNRRQDVYDLNILINHEKIEAVDHAKILESFLEKSHSRGITPTIESLDDKDLRNRSSREWDTMEIEVGVGQLPNFDITFEVVRNFYRNLPWSR